MQHLREKSNVSAADLARQIPHIATAIKTEVAKVPGLIDLTPKQRAHATKMHPGAEKYIRQMAALATAQPNVCPKGVKPETLDAQLDAVEQLEILLGALQAVVQTVEDTILLKSGGAYHDALDIYNVVQSHARRDLTLHAQIAAFEGFLATGPRQPHAEPTPTGTT